MAFALTKTFLAATSALIIGTAYMINDRIATQTTARVVEEVSEIFDMSWLTLIKVKPSYQMTAKDVECLAKNIFFEAALEPTMGKYAVAQVTLNRLRTGYWGTTICNVVYAPHQFSWTDDPKKRDSRPGHGALRGENWEHSLAVANDVADGRRVTGLKNALFYHADYVKPIWRHPEHKVDVVGRHIFYNQARGTQFDLTQ